MSGTSKAALAWILDHVRDHAAGNGCDDADCATCERVWPGEQRGALRRLLWKLAPLMDAYGEASDARDAAAEIESEHGTEIPPRLYHARDDAAVEVADVMVDVWPMLRAQFAID